MKTDYGRYLSNMSFLVKPFDEVPESMIPEFDSNSLPIPSTCDMDNVTLPFDNDKMKKSLAGVCVPKMSTFAIGALINLIVSELSENQAFLSIGAWHGFTFFCGLVNNSDKKCIGIDNFSEFTANHPKERFYEKFTEIKSEYHSFYEVDCFEYLKRHEGEIGFYIYDGEHTEENQFKGLKLAEPFFSDDCLVLIDDINLGLPVMRAIDTFLNQSKYEYKILFKQHTSLGIHPSFWNGIVLMQKGKKKNGRRGKRVMLKWHEVDGWFTDKECNAIQPLARGKICVEIGSYKGRSTLCLAEVAAYVHAVDTFMAGMGGQLDTGRITTLDEFKRNIMDYANVTPHIGPSLEVVNDFEDESVGLVLIDARHTYENVVDDTRAWWPKLCIGGYMVFHDYGGGFPGVKQAVDDCFEEVKGIASEHELAWVVKAKGVLRDEQDD